MAFSGNVTMMLNATCDTSGNAVVIFADVTFSAGEQVGYTIQTQSISCACCGGGGGCTCCCINLDAGGTGCCDNAGVIEGPNSAVSNFNGFCQTNGGACVLLTDCFACNTNPPTRTKLCNNAGTASSQPCLELRDCTNVVCSSCIAGNCHSTGTYNWIGPSSGCTPPGGGC